MKVSTITIRATKANLGSAEREARVFGMRTDDGRCYLIVDEKRVRPTVTKQGMVCLTAKQALWLGRWIRERFGEEKP